MHLRRLISVWALLTLMLGQITLAQHSVEHIDHGLSQEITVSYDNHDEHDEHEHDQDNNKHECPECSLAKSLQVAFYNAPAALTFALSVQTRQVQPKSYMGAAYQSKANAPRAPPHSLI